jgi:hypothetical protein
MLIGAAERVKRGGLVLLNNLSPARTGPTRPGSVLFCFAATDMAVKGFH